MYDKIKPLIFPLLAILGLLLIIMWMAGSFDDKIQPGIQASGQPFHGKTLTLKKTAVAQYEEVAATVRSKQTTQVASRILAPIKVIHVKAGDIVNRGDILIELDNRNNRSSVAQSRENINAIRANLEQAKSHFLRTKNLYAKDSVTKSQLEQASARYNSLKAQLASARQRLQSSETTSSYSLIRAPFTARVIDRFAEPGDLASPGMKLLTLYDPNSLRIDANIRESLALQLKLGQPLEAIIPALNKTLIATIEEIVPAADSGARSFLIKAKIDKQGLLLPGLYAKVRIPAGIAEQLLIPASYIKQTGQLNVVWILENQRAVRRFIRVGKQIGDNMLVIAGLVPGDRLISPKALK